MSIYVVVVVGIYYLVKCPELGNVLLAPPRLRTFFFLAWDISIVKCPDSRCMDIQSVVKFPDWCSLVRYCGLLTKCKNM